MRSLIFLFCKSIKLAFSAEDSSGVDSRADRLPSARLVKLLKMAWVTRAFTLCIRTGHHQAVLLLHSAQDWPVLVPSLALGRVWQFGRHLAWVPGNGCRQ